MLLTAICTHTHTHILNNILQLNDVNNLIVYKIFITQLSIIVSMHSWLLIKLH